MPFWFDKFQSSKPMASSTKKLSFMHFHIPCIKEGFSTGFPVG